MKEVFISYKAEEYNEAMAVKQVLEANGISCWMAPESISGGSNYASEIPRAIRECTVFVLILSEQAQQSRWVPKELDRAINCGKTVLPFMLENCPLKDDFNFYLTNVQRYEAYANKSRALEQMVKEIKALIDAGRRGEEEDCASLSPLPKEEAPPYEEKKEARSESAEKREGAPSFEETKRSSAKEEERSAPALKKEERSVPVKEVPAKKAPVKEVPAQKVPAGKTAEKKKKRRTGLVVGAIGAVVLCLLLALSGCIALAMQLDIIDRKITVGGERYSVNDLSPEFYGVRFTPDEAKKLALFDEAHSLYFEGCTFEKGALALLKLENISTLSLIDCGVDDAALAELALDGATRLIDLRLDGNGSLGDLSPLAALKEELYVLSFKGCAVKSESLSFLKDAEDLYALYADENGLEDLSFLGEVEGLTTLSVSANNLKSLRGIERCIRLEVLNAENNAALSTPEGLENATLLRKVDLSGCSISLFGFLAKSSEKLESLDLSGNPVSELSFLEGCGGLRELHLDGCGITSAEELAGCGALQILTLKGNDLVCLQGLEGCKELIRLDLSENEGLSSIEGLPMKEGQRLWLDLSDCALTQVCLPEGEQTFYELLDLGGNELADLSFLGRLEGSELVFSHSGEADYGSIADCGFYTITLLDCPLDRQVEAEEKLGSYRVTFMTGEEYHAAQKEG